MLREATSRIVPGIRRWSRDALGRRLAFLLESIDHVGGRVVDRAVRSPSGPTRAEECELLAVVAHWRGPSQAASDASDPALACLRALIDLPVRRLEIVVLTDDVAGAEALVGLLGDTGAASLRCVRWRPRGWRRHGYNLPWRHKDIFRDALSDGRLTHLLYLEDDIAFTRQNLEYWLAARVALAPRGLLPGLVRFERVGSGRMLVDQTRPGQHQEAGPDVIGSGIGEASVRISLRPYKACLLLDRALAVEHLRESAFRSATRSLVVRWDLRERAAAGATFGPTVRPLRGLLRPSAVQPPMRDAVLVASRGDASGRPLEGALIEHLRPTYSRDSSSRHGKVAVEDF